MHNWLVHRLAWGRPWEGADQYHMNNDHDETSSNHDDKMIILRIKLMVMMTLRSLPSWSRRWRWRTRPGGGVSSCARWASYHTTTWWQNNDMIKWWHGRCVLMCKVGEYHEDSEDISYIWKHDDMMRWWQDVREGVGLFTVLCQYIQRWENTMMTVVIYPHFQ